MPGEDVVGELFVVRCVVPVDLADADFVGFDCEDVGDEELGCDDKGNGDPTFDET